MSVISDSIKGRKSIRSFSSRPVSDDDIADIIEAGCMAPSPKNMQPWRVHIIKQPELRDISVRFKEMLDKNRKEDAGISDGCYRTAEIIGSSPVTLFIYSHNGGIHYELSLTQAIGAFIENMCLEASARGIGSLWCCDILHISGEINELFKIKDKLMACLVLGYPDSDTKRIAHKHAEDILV